MRYGGAKVDIKPYLGNIIEFFCNKIRHLLFKAKNIALFTQKPTFPQKKKFFPPFFASQAPQFLKDKKTGRLRGCHKGKILL